MAFHTGHCCFRFYASTPKIEQIGIIRILDFRKKINYMTIISDTIIPELVTAIVNEVDPEMILLFGSRAKGTNGPDSDIDLLIIEKEPFNASHRRWDELKRIRTALKNIKPAKDILVYSRQEVEYWKDSINHIIPTCLAEGIVLYERP
jgi:predicted nucleotidyltransferase